jgi:type II secretory pathway component PulF
MPHYRYQVKSGDGKMQTGVLAADNAVTAAAILRNQGQHVLSLTPANSTSKKAKGLVENLRKLNVGSGPTQKDILDFTTQLAVMIRAGISIRAALDGIADQTENPGFKKILLQLKNDVESGKQFSEAIAATPSSSARSTSTWCGRRRCRVLRQMLDRIAGYIAQQLETRKMVIGAMIYPGVIATMAVGVTVFLLTFVLPKFGAVFKGKEELLPWATNFLMGLSKFMLTQFWYIPLGGTFVFFIGLFLFSKTAVRSPCGSIASSSPCRSCATCSGRSTSADRCRPWANS